MGQARRARSVLLKALKVACSTLCAGITYFAWMAAFLVFGQTGGQTTRALLWITGPIVTALGFASGAALHERLSGRRCGSFLWIYLWPLVGCSAGAAAVFPFGPMLIVFAMFSVGATSMVLREVVRGERH